MTRDPFNYDWIESGKILAGSMPTNMADIDALYETFGIRAILSLTRRNIRDCPDIEYVLNGHQIEHLHLPITDGGLPDDDSATRALDFINKSYREGKPIFVHCRGGIARTGIILIAWYHFRDARPIETARSLVRIRRHRLDPNVIAGPNNGIQREWVNALEGKHL